MDPSLFEYVVVGGRRGLLHQRRVLLRGLVHLRDGLGHRRLGHVQALGGAGFLNDSVVSRLFRDAKLMEIGAGTSEIRRMLIGRELIGAEE